MPSGPYIVGTLVYPSWPFHDSVENLYLWIWSSEEKSRQQLPPLCPLSVAVGVLHFRYRVWASCHALTFCKERAASICIAILRWGIWFPALWVHCHSKTSMHVHLHVLSSFQFHFCSVESSRAESRMLVRPKPYLVTADLSVSPLCRVQRPMRIHSQHGWADFSSMPVDRILKAFKLLIQNPELHIIVWVVNKYPNRKFFFSSLNFLGR